MFIIIIFVIGVIYGIYDIARKNKIFNQSNIDTNVNLYDIEEMTGYDFEYFCAELLENIGFINVKVTPGSGDQGVDIVATKDNNKYAIQCKKYASKLGNTPIQEVYAGKQYYDCDIAVVLTNSVFSTKAVELARSTGVLLWDRKTLENMMTIAGFKNLDSYISNGSQIEENHNLDVEYESTEDISKEELKTLKLCRRLKNNIVVDTKDIDEMNLITRFNLVDSYTALKLNFEIINNSNSKFENGIIIKVNFYDEKNNLILIDNESINNKDISRKRYTDYFYFDFDEINKASKIEIDIYEDVLM